MGVFAFRSEFTRRCRPERSSVGRRTCPSSTSRTRYRTSPRSRHGKTTTKSIGLSLRASARSGLCRGSTGRLCSLCDGRHLQHRKRLTLMLDIPAHSLIASVVPAPGSIPGVLLGQDLIPLRAAFSQDEANHGAVRYLVDNNGLV